MNPFAYQRASSTPDALRAIAGHDAKFLGGGTNLVDLMKLGNAARRIGRPHMFREPPLNAVARHRGRSGENAAFSPGYSCPWSRVKSK